MTAYMVVNEQNHLVVPNMPKNCTHAQTELALKTTTQILCNLWPTMSTCLQECQGQSCKLFQPTQHLELKSGQDLVIDTS